jgi:hypothetical protein
MNVLHIIQQAQEKALSFARAINRSVEIGKSDLICIKKYVFCFSVDFFFIFMYPSLHGSSVNYS